MAQHLINLDWERHVDGGTLPEGGCVIVIRRSIVGMGMSHSPIMVARDFLSDATKPGQFAYRIRLIRDADSGYLQEQEETFWITDPDLAMEFKLRFG